MKYFLSISVLLSVSNGFTQHPLLDQSFGIGGKTGVDVDSIDHCEVVLSDSIGNIYFFGYTETESNGQPDRDYVIGKLNPSGNPETSFGVNGLVRGNFPGYDFCEITDAFIHSNHIIFGGNGGIYNNLDTQSVFVGKIDFDGNQDLAFGTNGFYSDTYTSEYSELRAMYPMEDGRFLITGVTFDSLVLHREIAFFGRLKTDGTRDSSFGTTGVRVWNVIDGLNDGMQSQDVRHIDGTVINDINLSPWGTYFLTGYFDNGSTFSVFTASVDTTGELDPGYNQGGILIHDFNPTLRQNGIVAKPYMGKMVLGLQPGNQGNYVIQAVESNGLLGTPMFYDVHGNHDEIEDMLLTELGELYFCGQSKLATSTSAGYTSDYFTCFRFEYSGMSIDSNFTDTMFFMESYTGVDESGSHSICESEQGIILGGYYNNVGPGNHSDFAFMRLLKNDSSVVNVEPHNLVKLQIYPNPGTGYFKINSDETFSYSLFSLDGKLVQNGLVNGWLDLSTINSGVYLLQLTNLHGRSITKRIIIEN